jgi:predicted kinase
MPKCYQLIGVPGAGKSTWYNTQVWAEDCVYVSTDMFVEDEAKRQDKTYSEVFKGYMPTAVTLMCGVVNEARRLKMDIIWDQTSTTVASRGRKFRMLCDYEHIAVVFKTPDPLELAIRLKNRPGKEIPQDVINSMIAGFEMPSEEEGFKEIWHAS